MVVSVVVVDDVVFDVLPCFCFFLAIYVFRVDSVVHVNPVILSPGDAHIGILKVITSQVRF